MGFAIEDAITLLDSGLSDGLGKMTLPVPGGSKNNLNSKTTVPSGATTGTVMVTTFVRLNPAPAEQIRYSRSSWSPKRLLCARRGGRPTDLKEL